MRLKNFRGKIRRIQIIVHAFIENEETGLLK